MIFLQRKFFSFSSAQNHDISETCFNILILDSLTNVLWSDFLSSIYEHVRTSISVNGIRELSLFTPSIFYWQTNLSLFIQSKWHLKLIKEP